MESQLKLALDFVDENNIKTVEILDLKSYIISQGFKVVMYKHGSNGAEVESLFRALRVFDVDILPKAFVYVDSDEKYVFVDNELRQDEKLYLMCRELGRILTESYSHRSIVHSAKSDRDSSEFAYHLLKLTNENSVWSRIKTSKVLPAVIGSCATLLIIFGVFAVGKMNSEKDDVIFSTPEKLEAQSDDVEKIIATGAYVPEIEQHNNSANNQIKADSGEDVREEDVNEEKTDQSGEVYYVTVSGKKYHVQGCRHIKNKDNLKELSPGSAELEKYEQCSVCMG